jgi:hypothetical protein
VAERATCQFSLFPPGHLWKEILVGIIFDNLVAQRVIFVKKSVVNITGTHMNNKACVRRDNGQERSWPDMCMPLQTLNGGVENLRKVLTPSAHWWRGNQKNANIITAACPALGQ